MSKDQEYDIADPEAGSLIESLRAFGYNLPTAIADLVDNSIYATARNIWVDFIWDGSGSRILIRDDGRGMTEGKLLQAMKIGSRSPLAVRDKSDLGRFGLGLKTASFSQCRRLTVLSKAKGSAPAVRCWDLDYIAEKGGGEWRLLKGNKLLSAEDMARLDDMPSGTVVFWAKADRIVGSAEADDVVTEKRFRERIDSVKQHLAMVFHRFFSGKGAVTIHLNGRELDVWDPFLENEKASDLLPAEMLRLDGRDIVVQPHVLPHHTKISKDTHRSAAGPRGWNAHQGFYVYRNRRLLVAGDWLGLGFQKEEHCKLARIRVDLPNSMDEEWQIDVRKARARPPSRLRADLKRIAKVTREKAVRIYRHRGKMLQRSVSKDHVFLWEERVRHGKIFYKINRKHPIVKKIHDTVEVRKDLNAFLNLIEQTVPVPLIVINNSEKPDTHGAPFQDVNDKEILSTARALFSALRSQGYDDRDAVTRLLAMEGIREFPELLMGLFEELGILPADLASVTAQVAEVGNSRSGAADA